MLPRHASVTIMRIALLLVAVVGCSKSPVAERCDRGVKRVFELTTHVGGGKPGADEQEIINDVQRQAIGTCESEGLTVEQLDCILAMKTFDDMKTVGACPAIKAKHPSWLLAP